MKIKLLVMMGFLAVFATPMICACAGDWNIMAAQPEPPGGGMPGDETEAEIVCLGDEDLAQYELVFEATWSAETHPNAFPPNPHFSGLIGATHNSEIAFWQPGELASPGIESMAETGSKSPLTTEIEREITFSRAEFELSGGGISPSPGSRSLSFEISEAFPLVSVVSMIAPSPDWFVGVHSLRLCDELGWAEEIIVDLLPWDSGTDSGIFYTSLNSNTNPPEPIALLTGVPVEVNDEVPPLGTFTFTRVVEEEEE